MATSPPKKPFLQAADPAELAPGTLIDGRYRVIRVIGVGGTGIVYEVEHDRTGQRLALKTLLDPSQGPRLEQEARALARLRSPHVVKVVELGMCDAGPFMVMSLLVGRNLRDVLETKVRLPLSFVANLTLQIAEGLDEAHRVGLVHRDLKPDNMHLADPADADTETTGPFSGSGQRPPHDLTFVTVFDFGVVKMSAAEINNPLTRTGSTVGTPYYMSLEQLRGAGTVDAQSDVYALCVVLYECLAGQRPFEAGTLGDLIFAICSINPPHLSTVRPDLPRDVTDIIMHGLSREKKDRPATMRDLAKVFAPHADPSFTVWLRVDKAPASLSPSRPMDAPKPAAPVASAAAPSAIVANPTVPMPQVPDARPGRGALGLPPPPPPSSAGHAGPPSSGPAIAAASPSGASQGVAQGVAPLPPLTPPNPGAPNLAAGASAASAPAAPAPPPTHGAPPRPDAPLPAKADHPKLDLPKLGGVARPPTAPRPLPPPPPSANRAAPRPLAPLQPPPAERSGPLLPKFTEAMPAPTAAQLEADLAREKKSNGAGIPSMLDEEPSTSTGDRETPTEMYMAPVHGDILKDAGIEAPGASTAVAEKDDEASRESEPPTGQKSVEGEPGKRAGVGVPNVGGAVASEDKTAILDIAAFQKNPPNPSPQYGPSSGSVDAHAVPIATGAGGMVPTTALPQIGQSGPISSGPMSGFNHGMPYPPASQSGARAMSHSSPNLAGAAQDLGGGMSPLARSDPYAASAFPSRPKPKWEQAIQDNAEKVHQLLLKGVARFKKASQEQQIVVVMVGTASMAIVIVVLIWAIWL